MFRSVRRKLITIRLYGGVWGVAHLHNKIFLVQIANHKVKIYEDSPPYRRIGSISFDGLDSPSDIVASAERSQLYIGDKDARCIWRLKIANTPAIAYSGGKWISSVYEPYSLSLRSNRLLVTPANENVLYVYTDMSPLSTSISPVRIPLPYYMDPHHAVETARGTFIVSHQGKMDDDTQHDQVSEVDARGNVIRAFGGQRGDGPQQLNYPSYLAVDIEDRVLVADCNNSRLVLLSPQLQFQCWLLTRDLDNLKTNEVLKAMPLRMCFVHGTGQLLIGLLGGATANLFITSVKETGDGNYATESGWFHLVDPFE